MARTTCALCGGELPGRENAKRRFCTDRCRYAFRDRKRFRQWGTPVSARCAKCDAEFSYRSTTKPRKYCSACDGRSDTGIARKVA